MPARNKQGARVSTKEGRGRGKGVDGKKKWEMKDLSVGRTLSEGLQDQLFSQLLSLPLLERLALVILHLHEKGFMTRSLPGWGLGVSPGSVGVHH